MQARVALSAMPALEIDCHAHAPLLDRIWSLRNNFSAYDAAYVALARGLGATLLTRDSRLAGAPGPSSPIDCLADLP